MSRTILLLALLLTLPLVVVEGQSIQYQTPPQVIADLADADPTPGVSISPNRGSMLLMHRPPMPGIAQVAQSELRLGGLRINPATYGGSRSRYYTGLSYKTMGQDQPQLVAGFPESPHLENVSWSPDATRVACTHTGLDGIELWIVDVNTLTASRLGSMHVNDVFPGQPFQWSSDSRHLLVKSTVAGDLPPEKDQVPAGPVVQENEKGSAPVRTYQDMLKNPHDEEVFAHYTSSELWLINVENGAKTLFHGRAIHSGMQISPDGEYVMITTLKRPFSYIVPYYRFAQEVGIYDRQGNEVKRLADIPASENIPKGFNAVRLGPRSFSWRNDKPATVYWVEARDGGDPKAEVDVRDQLFMLRAPFTAEARASIDFALRYGGISWGSDDLAIAREYWWSTRREIISAFAPEAEVARKNVLFDRLYEDRYSDPGDFEMTRNHLGRSVLLRSADGHLYLSGMGASEEGNRPFIDKFDPGAKTTSRLWRSEPPIYEIPVGFIDEEAGLVLTRREQKEVQPNFYLRSLKDGSILPITDFPNPYLGLQGVSKELVRYQRDDGIDLTGTLYLPAGYESQDDGPLPTLMWAYPREFKSKGAASQVRNSPHEFLRLYSGSPIFWVTRGYAVFDNFAMPIIGEGDEQPNETFTTQLVQGASAAIDKLVEMGVTDRNRIGVGGHSYGAFMTANLLAHSDLFAAGIARSGAYNRTLTPFGFQAEERTYWEAPEVYYTMSPFMHADKIKEPLLLIHGVADNNSGTYPMQSERFYAALKGHGSSVRLVMLPAESHGYRARESIMHMLWEQDAWLEKHVKNRQLDFKKP